MDESTWFVLFLASLGWSLVVFCFSVYYFNCYRWLYWAIYWHRAQRADDRCWLDDDVLYTALGDGIKVDRRVGDKAAMLKNCERFIDQRCEGGHWPTYEHLEREVKRLQALNEGLVERCARQSDQLTKVAEKRPG